MDNPNLSLTTDTATSLPYLAFLNETQKKAVYSTQGPLLVLAGAGTGKTRVLTARIVYILASKLANPSQVLAVTFTNKAALEMRERIAAFLNRPIEGFWLGTFHSLCARILRNHAEALDLTPQFTILDTTDQIHLMKQLMKAEDLDEKTYPPRHILAQIDRWKDRALTPDRIPSSELKTNFLAEIPVLKLYQEYQKRLKILNCVDFGDLILLCIELFRKNPDVLKQYQNQFRYILVDEYQDTNVVQYLWLRLLAQGHQNLCCVGDDDQSIYSWRGAEVANILRFEKDFPKCEIIRLEQNYRSTGHILGAASALISHNKSRMGKTLWTEGDVGDPILIQGTWDGSEEAHFVGDQIETLRREGKRLGEIAVLVRASWQTRELEERLLYLNIPYRVVGGLRFYERKEIRDAIAYLRVLHQPADSLALERILNTPRRGIGPTALQTLYHFSRIENVPLFLALQALVDTDEIKGKARQGIQAFLNDFGRWKQLSTLLEPAKLAAMILDESGYTGMLQKDLAPDAPSRLENLNEFVTALAEFSTLGEFLEHVSLVMENVNTTKTEGVNLMTLHSAKGLEFDTVFLIGWEEGLFPHARCLDEGLKGLEEERRLAYVALTRARRQVIITFAVNRHIYGEWKSNIPSRFIEELPSDHIHLIPFQNSSAQQGQEPLMRAFDDDFLEFENTSTTILRPGNKFSSFSKQRNWSKQGHPYPQKFHSNAFESTLQKAYPSVARSIFKVDDRVFHQKFGYGTVEDISDDKLEIFFDHAGLKKVIASFVEKVNLTTPNST